MIRELLRRFLSYKRGEQLKTVLAFLIWYGGVGLLARYRRPRPAILLYHSVGSRDVFQDNVISEARFTEQIGYLLRHRRIVSVSQMVEALKRGQRIPGDWLAITFDDGYKDNLTVAAAVLAQHNVPGSFYVTWDGVSGRSLLFFDEIHALATNCSAAKVMIGSEPFDLSSSSDDELAERILRIVLEIRDKEVSDRNAVLESLRKNCGPVTPKPIYMNEADLHQLRRMGMEVGSHTLSHPNLASLSEEQLVAELVESKDQLEALTGEAIFGIAYPFGKDRNCGERERACARDAGYVYGLTTNFGFVDRAVDQYALPRIGVRDAPLFQLKVALTGIKL